jgi:uncharacterized protein YegL
LAGEKKNITAEVNIPALLGTVNMETITVYAKSDYYWMYSDSVLLNIIIYPHLEARKSVDPSTINLFGLGVNEYATITLNVSGAGFPLPGLVPQDVIFLIDTSGSMDPNDVKYAQDSCISYVDNMSVPDTGAVIYFRNIIDKKSNLTTDYDQLKLDLAEVISPVGSTFMGAGVENGTDELIDNGNPDHIWVMILISDGEPTHDPVDVISAAERAAQYGIMIYTIGLGPFVNESLLQDIAAITYGQYYHAETGLDLEEIYYTISTKLSYIAGKDNTSDAVPMILDTLPPYINYVPGSFSIPPDYIFTNGTGYTFIQWNVSALTINESFIVTFVIYSTESGIVPANNFTNSRINYTNWNDESVERLFPETWINVLTSAIKPPDLFIQVINSSLQEDGKGDIIRLSWSYPGTKPPNLSHYLIYQSGDQRSFNFSNPLIDTSQDIDGSKIPLRTTWNFTSDASNSAPQEYYYIIRAVDTNGDFSTTSRTVGKWTKIFESGVQTFSLPLEPIQLRDTRQYALDMNASYIKWMDPGTHTWREHTKGEMSDIITMILGQGYEVKFEAETKYTFTGMPGAMIMYDNQTSFGFDYNVSSGEAASLSAVPDYTGVVEVDLLWLRPDKMRTGIDFYRVLYSDSRDGFWGFESSNYFLLDTVVAGVESAQDSFPLSFDGTDRYYMIVPVNASTGEIGASSYSVGVWCAVYDGGYDTLALPLKLEVINSADWYCDNIQDSVGINYFAYGNQRWSWHRNNMAEGVYDSSIMMSRGYQISTSAETRFIFSGV